MSLVSFAQGCRDTYGCETHLNCLELSVCHFSQVLLIKNLPLSKKQLCAKEYHNRFRKSQVKGEKTDRQTDRHFLIYNSRDKQS